MEDSLPIVGERANQARGRHGRSSVWLACVAKLVNEAIHHALIRSDHGVNAPGRSHEPWQIAKQRTAWLAGAWNVGAERCAARRTSHAVFADGDAQGTPCPLP